MTSRKWQQRISNLATSSQVGRLRHVLGGLHLLPVEHRLPRHLRRLPVEPHQLVVGSDLVVVVVVEAAVAAAVVVAVVEPDSDEIVVRRNRSGRGRAPRKLRRRGQIVPTTSRSRRLKTKPEIIFV